MGYELFHDQAWGESATVKLRVFVSGPHDNPNRELTLTVETGDGTSGSTTVLSEMAGDGLHSFHELYAELAQAIEFAETGDVTDGNQ